LGFDLTEMGVIIGILYILVVVIMIAIGFLADWLLKEKILSTLQVRKYFNCFAFIAQTTFLLLAAYNRNRIAIVTFLLFGAMLGGFATCGYGVNHLDIAPRFASILAGIINTFATIPGMIAPLIAGFIVTDQSVSLILNNNFFLNKCSSIFRMLINGSGCLSLVHLYL
jgi:MFS transporter, ACS family, solute carrier family 17 (sodium-dependent inorganic phosphate cotransporter), other